MTTGHLDANVLLYALLLLPTLREVHLFYYIFISVFPLTVVLVYRESTSVMTELIDDPIRS